MDAYIIVIAYYLLLLIGLCGMIIGANYVLDKAYSALLQQFRFYNEFVRFVYDRHRKKKSVVTPTIKREGDDNQ